LLAVAIILLVVAPLAHVFDIATREENNMGVSEVRSLTALIDVYTSAEYLEPLAHTFVLAVVVTVLSLLAGVGMAVIVARTNIPFT
jgi:ABC-type Fe3+ transport system permease subunit